MCKILYNKFRKRNLYTMENSVIILIRQMRKTEENGNEERSKKHVLY